MINLLKNNSKISNTENIKENAAEDLTVETENKININRYKDPEGLTLKKMQIGLWLVEHRQRLIQSAIIFLIVISLFCWSSFFYAFGRYILQGMKNDRIMNNGLITENLISHDFFVQHSAKDLQISQPQMIKLANNKYDFFVEVKNLNSNYWAEFAYYFKIGNQELTLETNYILPGETKYLLTLGQELNSPSADIKFYFKNFEWQRINKHIYPDWKKFTQDHLNIAIAGEKFTSAQSTNLTEKVNLNTLEFFATNNTPYNYWDVNFVIVLSSQGKVAGVLRYDLENFMSEQKREVKITWPGNLGLIRDIIITPEINITRNDIYIKYEGRSDETEGFR